MPKGRKCRYLGLRLEMGCSRRRDTAWETAEHGSPKPITFSLLHKNVYVLVVSTGTADSYFFSPYIFGVRSNVIH